MLSTTQEANEYRKKFHEYYNENILLTLQQFEEERKATYFKFKLYCVLIVLYVSVPVIWAIHLGNQVSEGVISIMPDWFLYVGVFFLVTTLLFLLGALKTKKNFENKLKEIVLKPFLLFFGHFQWKRGERLGEIEIWNSKLVKNFNRFISDDYFEGNFRGVDIIISELKLLEVNGKGDSSHHVFDGIFIKLSSKKTINFHTIINEKVSLESLLLPQNFSKLNKTELEDVEFNKIFDVHTDDEVEARYLITTAFIERFKHLKQMFNAKEIRASFKDNSVLIALSCKKDMFVLGDIRKPITDSQEIQTLFEEFLAVISIVEILNLDSKTGL